MRKVDISPFSPDQHSVDFFSSYVAQKIPNNLILIQTTSHLQSKKNLVVLKHYALHYSHYKDEIHICYFQMCMQRLRNKNDLFTDF